MASPVSSPDNNIQVLQIYTRPFNAKDQKREKIIRIVDKIFIGLMFFTLATALTLSILNCFGVASPLISGLAQASGVLSLVGCLYFIGKYLYGDNQKRMRPNDTDVIVTGGDHR